MLKLKEKRKKLDKELGLDTMSPAPNNQENKIAIN